MKSNNNFKNLISVIYSSVGTKENYTNVYNCVTRLRINVKDKNLVNEQLIKQQPEVKSIVWSGSEFQIVIGPNVNKVKDAFLAYELKQKYANKDSQSFMTKIKGGINGVMGSLIPLLVTAGFLYAIQTLLISFKLIDEVALNYDPEKVHLITQENLFAGIVYIICGTGLTFLGIFFLFSVVDYLGGNKIIAILIALTLSSPALFSGQSWTLFKIGDYAVTVKSYAGDIIPMVFAGIMYFYIDKWIKTWMPSVVDLVFRQLLAVVIVLVSMFFVFGPILAIVQSGIFYVFIQADKLPFGISAALFALCFQFLVVIGVAWAITAPLWVIAAGTTEAAGIPSTMLIGIDISVWAQFGAGIAVAIKSTNKEFRQLSISTVTTAFFGITEPILYGVNIPKKTPFIYGSIASGISAWIVGALGAKAYQPGGLGPFAIFKYVNNENPVWNIVFIIMGWILAIGLGLLFTYLFYKERIDEKKNTIKLNKKLIKKFKIKNSKDLDQLVLLIENNKELITNLEKEYRELSELKFKIKEAEEKLELSKNKISKKIEKAVLKENLELIKTLETKLDELEKDNKINELTIQEQQLVKQIEANSKKYQKLIDDYLKQVNLVFESQKIDLTLKTNQKLLNNYQLSINSLKNNFS